MNQTIHDLLVMYRRITNKVFQLLNITVYFETKYGVKAYNKKQFALSQGNSIVEINPQNVYLSFDALNDNYTFIDTLLEFSPHVDMIRRIYNHDDISNSRYIRCELLGCLDGRYEQTGKKELIQMHINAAFANNNIEYPILYQLNGRYYVVDGKHRLSTALVKQEHKVRCVIVPLREIGNYVYTRGILCKMKKTSCLYQKNIKHIELILNNM